MTRMFFEEAKMSQTASWEKLHMLAVVAVRVMKTKMVSSNCHSDAFVLT
jgi:hypothetical protein